MGGVGDLGEEGLERDELGANDLPSGGEAGDGECGGEELV